MPNPAPLRPWVLVVFAAIYLYAFPYFDALRSANETPRVLTTQELVERGTFRLDARMGELGSWYDIAPTPGPHYYQNKAPGASVLAVPAYVLLKRFGLTSVRVSTWAFRVTVSTLPALLFLWIFYRSSFRFTDSEPARRTALIALALASPALPYSVLFLSHQPAAVASGASFAAALWVARGQASRARLLMATSGLLAGTAVALDYQSIIASAGVALYVVLVSRRRLRDLPPFALAALIPAVLLALYHDAAFGSPLKTGYNFSNAVHEQGFLGLVGPSWQALYYTLLDPSNGLFVLAPWSLFAFVGLVAIAIDRDRRRRVGAEAAACAFIVFGYIAFLGSLVPWFARAGWCVGPRYMTVALPFLTWLAATGFEVAFRRLWLRVLAQAMVVASGVFFLVATTTYPHWPEYLRNPLYELAFRLLWNGYAVHSLGTLVGLRGLWSVLPVYLLALGASLWLLRAGRQRIVTALVICLLAAGIVASHRAFPTTGPDAIRAYGWITSVWEPKP